MRLDLQQRIVDKLFPDTKVPVRIQSTTMVTQADVRSLFRASASSGWQVKLWFGWLPSA